jgi:hypothetical protein
MELSGGEEEPMFPTDLNANIDARDQPYVRGPTRWGPRSLKETKQEHCTICPEKNASQVLQRVNLALGLAIAEIGREFDACCAHVVEEYNRHVDTMYLNHPADAKKNALRHLTLEEFFFHARMCPTEPIVSYAIHEQHLLGAIRTLQETAACYTQADGTTVVAPGSLKELERCQKDLAKTQKDKNAAKKELLERRQQDTIRGVRFAKGS